MPTLYSAQQIQGHINISGDSPWFNKRLQLGRTCIKGPKFCLSASNSERYLHKAREQLLHSLISFQPVNITVTYSCVPNLKLLLPSGEWSSFSMLLHAVWHVLEIGLTALKRRFSHWPFEVFATTLTHAQPFCQQIRRKWKGIPVHNPYNSEAKDYLFHDASSKAPWATMITTRDRQTDLISVLLVYASPGISECSLGRLEENIVRTYVNSKSSILCMRKDRKKSICLCPDPSCCQTPPLISIPRDFITFVSNWLHFLQFVNLCNFASTEGIAFPTHSPAWQNSNSIISTREDGDGWQHTCHARQRHSMDGCPVVESLLPMERIAYICLPFPTFVLYPTPRYPCSNSTARPSPSDPSVPSTHQLPPQHAPAQHNFHDSFLPSFLPQDGDLNPHSSRMNEQRKNWSQHGSKRR